MRGAEVLQPSAAIREGSLATTGACCPDSLGSSCLELRVCAFDPRIFFVELAFSFQADKKDSQGNNTVSGFEILLQKQLKGKQMQKEMAEFVRER